MTKKREGDFMKKLFFLLLCFSFPVLAIECPPDKPMEYKGECYPCENGNNLFSEEECNKCPEFRKFENGRCTFTKSPYPDRPLMYVQEDEIPCFRGRRYHSRPCGHREKTYFSSCYNFGYERVTEENCLLCSNRKFENGFCILKECPQKYFRNSNGSCLDCSHNYPYKTSEEECHRCSNRKYENGVCSKKECTGGFVKKAGEECISCQRLIDGAIDMEKSECQKCPNSEYKEGKCYNKCSENEFRDETGKCVWCNQKEREITASEFECNKCSNRLHYGDGKCLYLISSETQNENSCDTDWLFVNDHCERCDSSETFKVSESDCLKCNQYEELRVYDSQSGECKPKQ